jgi:hypothetical protein
LPATQSYSLIRYTPAAPPQFTLPAPKLHRALAEVCSPEVANLAQFPFVAEELSEPLIPISTPVSQAGQELDVVP